MKPVVELAEGADTLMTAKGKKRCRDGTTAKGSDRCRVVVLAYAGTAPSAKYAFGIFVRLP